MILLRVAHRSKIVIVTESVIAREKTEGGEIRIVRVESVKTIEEGKKKKC
jgi:hypothetical protein